MVDTAPWAGDGTVLVNTAYTQLWPLPGTGQLRRERERETLLPQSGPGNVWSLEARQPSEWAQHSLGRRQEAAQRLGLAWPGLARSQHYSSL